ncbi:MAG: toll/interleukin-1 receptor domain-containing protein [Gemmatimonas sp.]
MHWTINGRRVSTANAGDALKNAMHATVVDKLRDHLHERFGRIRHPQTGETPTVVVEGDSLEAMRVNIEGSPELLALVAETLSPEERERYLPNLPTVTVPKVFLGFGTEDQPISDRIVHALHAAGVHVEFYAPWDLSPGDSVPAGITAGLDGSTHFLSLWTPQSMKKPWVLQEVHAAFMRRMRGDMRFFLVRYGTEVSSIPAIMSDILSPELRASDFDDDLAKLIRDIQGVSRRPALVSTPPRITRDERYTAAALAVARRFVEASRTGRWGDPSLDGDELQAQTGLSATEIEDATYELGAFLHTGYPGSFAAKNELFAEFDDRWCAWNPAADALRIAADLVNAGKTSTATEALLTQYEWPVRRMNPALTYLSMRRLVLVSETIAHRMVTSSIRTTPETRRFVQSRSGL